MAVMVFAPLTGAGFNPARAIGPAVASGEWGGFGQFLLVYVLAPVIGALVAVFLYLQILAEPGAKGVGGAEPVG
jgi:glycerol uptake facilitator-like aquaporin